MNERNPFSLMYGKSPYSIINRDAQYNEIIDTFCNENPSTYSYVITGIRGSGKTVLLRTIANELSSKNNWIVIDANPQDDFIKPLSEKLLYEGKKHKLFTDWSITINAKIASLTISNKNVYTNPEIIFEKLLKDATKQKKNVLITIDEVNSTKELKKFANFYQSMIGKNYNLFLLMTGLKNNINALISSDASSFLSRTPKIDLMPLDEIEISHEYKRIFNISTEMSIDLAKLTRGYAFAYQVLGYLFYNYDNKKIDGYLLDKYDKYLQTNGYDVIWKDLTNQEKNICFALNESNNTSNKIQNKIKMSETNYQNYRKKLIEKGIIEPDGYGKLKFSLPRFEQFVSIMKLFE